MNKPLPPSRLAASAADLSRAVLPSDEVSRMILAGNQQAVAGGGSGFDPSVLLAAILKSQVKANSRYNVTGWQLDDFQQQMIFTENPLRNYLLVQNVGSGDLMIIFEDTGVEVQDFSTAASQQQLIDKQTRAVRIVAGGYFEPLVPPTNSITIFTLNTATVGIAIQGS